MCLMECPASCLCCRPRRRPRAASRQESASRHQLQVGCKAAQYLNQSTGCWPADTLHACAGECHASHPQQQPLVAMRGLCLEHASQVVALHEDCASCFCSGAAPGGASAAASARSPSAASGAPSGAGDFGLTGLVGHIGRACCLICTVVAFLPPVWRHALAEEASSASEPCLGACLLQTQPTLRSSVASWLWEWAYPFQLLVQRQWCCKQRGGPE